MRWSEPEKNATGCPCHFPVTVDASSCNATVMTQGAPFVSDAGSTFKVSFTTAPLHDAGQAEKSIVAANTTIWRRVLIGAGACQQPKTQRRVATK